MIQAIFAFVVLALCFGIGIQVFRNMSGKEKWQLTKTLAYAILCSALAMFSLILLVVLF